MTAGTAAQAIMVKMISHTAVVFSAINKDLGVDI